MDSIVSISQYHNSKTWMMNVKREIFENLIGRCLQVDGQTVILVNANTYADLNQSYLDKPVTATAIFRLNRLPHNFSGSEIKAYFTNKK